MEERHHWLWRVAQRCWKSDPRDRPTALQVMVYMHPDYKVARLGLQRRLGIIGLSIVIFLALISLLTFHNLKTVSTL